jgi:hypothetical protein
LSGKKHVMEVVMEVAFIKSMTQAIGDYLGLHLLNTMVYNQNNVIHDKFS